MRQLRVIPEGEFRVHTITRTVDRKFFFGDQEKAVILKILRKLSRALDVKILGYALMSNHIHLLLELPDKDSLPALTEESLMAKLKHLYDGNYILDVKQQFECARKQSRKPETLQRRIDEILAPYEKRRADLSIFMKELKQRISIYVNNKHNRVGTLWEGRYKSVLVGNDEFSLLTMAAYIDLNPVRAGLVSKPEDYRWCSYAEALAGNRKAQNGLQSMMVNGFRDDRFEDSWKETQARYRQFLFEEGEEVKGDATLGQRNRKGMTRSDVDAVIEQSGEISVPLLLRHKVRYFSDGLILGTEAFVNQIFERHRSTLTNQGTKRKTGARKLRGGDWGELRVYRDLQKDVIG
ncbi:MAG: transposase [Verrucomicrobiota bacterium]